MADVAAGKPVTRLALVIGNANYIGSDSLRNPANDARAMADALRRLGFQVNAAIDLASGEMLSAVGTFCRELAEASAGGSTVSAILFYAGHGIQVDSENYLLPVDADIRNKLELRSRCVELNVVMEAMGSAAATSVILLDCCRNNPLPRTLDGRGYRGLASEHGLANVRAPKGVYVAFATQPHFVALDGEGDNSPFTKALLAHVDAPLLQISEVMMRVRIDVYNDTKGTQIPWDHSALFEPFVFAEVDPHAPPEGLPPEAVERLRREREGAREQSYWQAVRATRNVAYLQSFIVQFPNSEHREAALARIDALRRRSVFRSVATLAIGALVGLYVLYVGVNWARFTRIDQARIVGGEIEADNWREKSSYLWCKARCVGLTECKAFTYDPVRERCQLKRDAAFYEPARVREGEATEYSEYTYGITPPRRTRFRLHWAKFVQGTAIPRAALEQVSGLKSKIKSDRRSGEEYLQLSALECQQTCEEMGEACKGFSHTRWGGGCELFSSVKGFYMDPRNNRRPLFSPATISGCLEPTIEDCSPRVASAPAPVGSGAKAKAGEKGAKDAKGAKEGDKGGGG